MSVTTDPVVYTRKLGTAAHVIVVDDPILKKITDRFDVDPGVSISDLIADGRINVTDSPTILFLNAVPVLEKDFPEKLKKGDLLTVVRQPGYVWVVWAAFALAAASFAYSLYMYFTAPEPWDDQGGASPTYSISYKGNRRRPGEAIPVVLGTFRVYPDLSGQVPIYINNDQWVYTLFDVTQGHTDPITEDDINFEDTPLTNFSGYEFEYLEPGDKSQLFPYDPIISGEVDKLEINTTAYTPEFVVNPVATTISSLTFDIIGPQGIYRVNEKSGHFRNITVNLTVEYREIDDGGGNIGGWVAHTQRIPGNHRKPVRFSIHLPGIPEGRYKVRMKRSPAAQNDQYRQDKVIWERVWGASPDQTVYTTTRLAIRIRASEQIGSSALTKMNVLVKRQLDVWNGNTWSRQQTNSAAWAFADMVRAEYGGNLPDSRLDLPGLLALSTRPLSEFNGIYDKRGTMWDALNDAARSFLGRAVELPGNIYSIIPDDEAVLPIALFTSRNIVAESMDLEYQATLDLDEDSVEITYQNKDEGYRETSVLCVPYGQSGDRPLQITTRGITDADQAYDFGIRRANEILHRRQKVSFETGIEGFIPSFGDTVAVNSYTLSSEADPRSISGELASNSGSVLTPYEDLSHLNGESDLYCYLRDDVGAPVGPLACTVLGGIITVLDAFDQSILKYGANRQGPLFAVGKYDEFITLVKVFEVSQAGAASVKITGVVDNPNVYIKDDVPAYSPIRPPIILAPTVTNLLAELLGEADEVRVQLSWQGENADSFLIEMSEDLQVTWTTLERTSETSVIETIPIANSIWMRVTGVKLFAGIPATVEINSGDYELVPPSLIGLRAQYPFDANAAAIAWNPIPAGHAAEVEVYWNGQIKHIETLPTDALGYVFTRDESISIESASIDGTTYPVDGARDITFQVYTVDEDGKRSPVYQEISLSNEQMQSLKNVTAFEKDSILHVRWNWPLTDWSGVEIHLSETPGFTPGPSTLLYRGNSNDLNISGELEYPTIYYLRVGGFDVWGTEGIDYGDEYEVITTVGADVKAGDGVNRVSPAYAIYFNNDRVPHEHDGGDNSGVFIAEDLGFYGAAALMLDNSIDNAVGGAFNVWLAAGQLQYNMAIVPESRWIIQFRARMVSSTSNLRFGIDDEFAVNFVVSEPIHGNWSGSDAQLTTDWQFFSGVIDMTASLATRGNVRLRHLQNNPREILIDGLMIERSQFDITEKPVLGEADVSGFNSHGQEAIKTATIIHEATTSVYWFLDPEIAAEIPSGTEYTYNVNFDEGHYLEFILQHLVIGQTWGGNSGVVTLDIEFTVNGVLVSLLPITSQHLFNDGGLMTTVTTTYGFPADVDPAGPAVVTAKLNWTRNGTNVLAGHPLTPVLFNTKVYKR